MNHLPGVVVRGMVIAVAGGACDAGSGVGSAGEGPPAVVHAPMTDWWSNILDEPWWSEEPEIECEPNVVRQLDGSCDGGLCGALETTDAGTTVRGLPEEAREFGSFVAVGNFDDDPERELLATYEGFFDLVAGARIWHDPIPRGEWDEDSFSTVKLIGDAIFVSFDWGNGIIDLDADGRDEYYLPVANDLQFFEIPDAYGVYNVERRAPKLNLYTGSVLLWGAVGSSPVDMTADGIRDLWVPCSTFESFADGGGINTRVCLVAGPLVGDRNVDAGDFAARYSRSDANAWIGNSILIADFTGDGDDDLVVSGLGPLDEQPGTVTLVTDPPMVDASLADVATTELVGKPWEGLGYNELANVGDVDGDGYSDLGASVGLHRPYGVGESIDGGVALFYGPINGDFLSSDCADARVVAGLDYTIANHSLKAGDFNADGFSDIVAGTIWDKWLFYGPLHSGVDLTEQADVIFGAEGYIWGEETAVGDLDGDGIDDLVIGGEWETNVEHHDGSVFVFYGGQ